MVKVINKYETIFVLDMTLGEEKITALADKFKNMIGEAGEIESVEEWGKRRLAYPINDLTEGYYTLVHFSSEPGFIAELDRVYNITDGVLRTMIIRKDEKNK